MNLRGARGIERAIVEVLETRRMLSASAEVIDRTLVIRGTPDEDHVWIWGGETFLGVTLNGQEHEFQRRLFDAVEMHLGDGDDDVSAMFSDHPVLVFGGAGGDRITAGNRRDTLVGGDGNDTIYGGRGDDRLLGKGGSDNLDGEVGADFVSGGEADDRFHAEKGPDTLRGGAGYDTIFTLTGDNDIVDMGADGADVRDSSVEVKRAPGEATIDLVDGVLEVRTTGGELNNIRPWFGSRYVSMRVNDLVRDFPADDVAAIRIIGGEGSDSISFWMQAPERIQLRFYGGAGDDYYWNDHPRATVYGGEGNDYIVGGESDDVLYGGPGDDALYGHGGSDFIRGGDGKDNIDGYFGDDTLLGGDGDDVIDDAVGTDYMSGGGGNDTIGGQYWQSESTSLIEHDRLRGGDGDDTIHAYGGDDTLKGDAGADELYGGVGNDVLRGDEEDAVLDGQIGDNLVLRS